MVISCEMGRGKILRMSSFSESAASRFMADVPDDLLVEILIRLPDCQRAIQCSMICKRWHFLISNPGFVRRFIHHHDHNQQLLDKAGSQLSTPTLLFQKHEKRTMSMHYGTLFYEIFPEKLKISHERPTLPLSSSSSCLKFLPCDVVVRASFHDLLLVSQLSDFTNFYICNALTRRWCGLPQAPHGIVTPMRCGLVCQPDDCSKEHRCTTNAQYRYKVVLFGYAVRRCKDRISVTIFCSETGQWSQLITIPAILPLTNWVHVGGRPWTLNQVVASNGILHWIESNVLMVAEGIVALGPFSDSDVKQCRYIALPCDIHPVRFPFCMASILLGTCKGRLRMSQLFTDNGDRLVLKVWELRYHDKNAATSWSLMHNVALEIKAEVIYVLAFDPSNGNVIFLFCDNEVWQYDMLQGKGKNVGEFPVEIRTPHLQISVFTLMHSSWPTPVTAPALSL